LTENGQPTTTGATMLLFISCFIGLFLCNLVSELASELLVINGQNFFYRIVAPPAVWKH